MDLTPPPGSYDPFLGTSGFVPGWTVLGSGGYSGYAWYRLKVNVQFDSAALAKGGLRIKMPNDVDDAYQVFVNGRLIGEFGHFTKNGITSYLTLPRSFALPADIKDGEMTIAIRVWMDPSTPLTNPDTGGLHGPPVLGHAKAVEAMLQPGLGGNKPLAGEQIYRDRRSAARHDCVGSSLRLRTQRASLPMVVIELPGGDAAGGPDLDRKLHHLDSSVGHLSIERRGAGSRRHCFVGSLLGILVPHGPHAAASQNGLGNGAGICA